MFDVLIFCAGILVGAFISLFAVSLGFAAKRGDLTNSKSQESEKSE